MLSDNRVRELAKAALPRGREVDVRTHLKDPTMEEIWEKAALQEDIKQWLSNEKNDEEAYPAQTESVEKDREDETRIPKKTKNVAGPAADGKACGRCGQTGHSGRQCPKMTWRCFNYNLIGHVAAACRNFVEKDEKGRVILRLESKPSGTVLKNAKDRSAKDKMLTDEATIQAVRESGEKKRQRAAKKKQEKEQQAGRVAKKRKIEHPAGVAQTTDDEAAEDATMERDSSDTVLVGIEQHVKELTSKGSVMRVSASINGIQHTVVSFSLLRGAVLIKNERKNTKGRKKRKREVSFE